MSAPTIINASDYAIVLGFAGGGLVQSASAEPATDCISQSHGVISYELPIMPVNDPFLQTLDYCTATTMTFTGAGTLRPTTIQMTNSEVLSIIFDGSLRFVAGSIINITNATFGSVVVEPSAYFTSTSILLTSTVMNGLLEVQGTYTSSALRVESCSCLRGVALKPSGVSFTLPSTIQFHNSNVSHPTPTTNVMEWKPISIISFTGSLKLSGCIFTGVSATNGLYVGTLSSTILFKMRGCVFRGVYGTSAVHLLSQGGVIDYDETNRIYEETTGYSAVYVKFETSNNGSTLVFSQSSVTKIQIECDAGAITITNFNMVVVDTSASGVLDMLFDVIVGSNITISNSSISTVINLQTSIVTDCIFNVLVAGSTTNRVLLAHEVINNTTITSGSSLVQDGGEFRNYIESSIPSVGLEIIMEDVSAGSFLFDGTSLGNNSYIHLSHVTARSLSISHGWTGNSWLTIASSNFTSALPAVNIYTSFTARIFRGGLKDSLGKDSVHRIINTSFSSLIPSTVCALCYMPKEPTEMLGTIVIEGSTFEVTNDPTSNTLFSLVTSGILFITDTNSFHGGALQIEMKGGLEQRAEVHIANSNVSSLTILQGFDDLPHNSTIVTITNTIVAGGMTSLSLHGYNLTTILSNNQHGQLSKVSLRCTGPIMSGSQLSIDNITTPSLVSLVCQHGVFNSTVSISDSEIFSTLVQSTDFEDGSNLSIGNLISTGLTLSILNFRTRSSILLSNCTFQWEVVIESLRWYNQSSMTLSYANALSIKIEISDVYDTSSVVLDQINMVGTLTLDSLQGHDSASVVMRNLNLLGDVEIRDVVFRDSSSFTVDSCFMNTTLGFQLVENMFTMNAMLTVRNSTFWGDYLGFGQINFPKSISGNVWVVVRSSSFNTRMYSSGGGTLRLFCTSGNIDHDESNIHSGPSSVYLSSPTVPFASLTFHLHNSAGLRMLRLENGAPNTFFPPPPTNISIVNCTFTSFITLSLRVPHSGASLQVDGVVTAMITINTDFFSDATVAINNLTTKDFGLQITVLVSMNTSYIFSSLNIINTLAMSLNRMNNSLVSIADTNSSSTISVSSTSTFKSCLRFHVISMQTGTLTLQGPFINSSVLISACTVPDILFESGELTSSTSVTISSGTIVRTSGVLFRNVPIHGGSMVVMRDSFVNAPSNAIFILTGSPIQNSSTLLISNMTLMGSIVVVDMDSSSLVYVRSTNITSPTGYALFISLGSGFYFVDTTTQLNGNSIIVQSEAQRIYYLTLPAPWGADNTCESMIEFPATTTCAVCGLQPWHIDPTPTTTLTANRSATELPTSTATPTPSLLPTATSNLSISTTLPSLTIKHTHHRTQTSTIPDPPTTTNPTCASNTQEASPCTYITNLTYTVNATDDIHRYTPPNNTTASCILSPSTSTTATPSQFVVAVPHGLWSASSTSAVLVSMRLSEAMVGALNASVVLGTSPEVPSIVRSVTSGSSDIVLTPSSAPFAVYSAGRVLQAGWIVLRLRYIGPTSRSTHRTEAAVLLNETCFGSCALSASVLSEGIRFTVELSAAPVTLSPSIETLADVSVVASAVTAIPSAVVRAGIANSLLGMCGAVSLTPLRQWTSSTTRSGGLLGARSCSTSAGRC